VDVNGAIDASGGSTSEKALHAYSRDDCLNEIAKLRTALDEMQEENAAKDALLVENNNRLRTVLEETDAKRSEEVSKLNQSLKDFALVVEEMNSAKEKVLHQRIGDLTSEVATISTEKNQLVLENVRQASEIEKLKLLLSEMERQKNDLESRLKNEQREHVESVRRLTRDMEEQATLHATTLDELRNRLQLENEQLQATLLSTRRKCEQKESELNEIIATKTSENEALVRSLQQLKIENASREAKMSQEIDALNRTNENYRGTLSQLTRERQMDHENLELVLASSMNSLRLVHGSLESFSASSSPLK
jgi:chromosome segregation ATPase